MKRLASQLPSTLTCSAGKFFCPVIAFVPFCANSHCLVSVLVLSEIVEQAVQCAAMLGGYLGCWEGIWVVGRVFWLLGGYFGC